jgi:histidine phosphotransferase ChpT
MLLLAMAGIPRGGVVTVTVEGQNLKVRAQGERAKLPQAMADILHGAAPSETLDARLVQPYYTRLVSQSASLAVNMAMDGEDAVVVNAA